MWGERIRRNDVNVQMGKKKEGGKGIVVSGWTNGIMQTETYSPYLGGLLNSMGVTQESQFAESWF